MVRQLDRERGELDVQRERAFVGGVGAVGDRAKQR